MIAYERNARSGAGNGGRLPHAWPADTTRRDVLRLVLGQPNKVIAYELDISARTVESIGRVMEK